MKSTKVSHTPPRQPSHPSQPWHTQFHHLRPPIRQTAPSRAAPRHHHTFSHHIHDIPRPTTKMSERGQFRGGSNRGGQRGGRGGGGARGGSHNNNPHSNTEQAARPKKENILDLNKYIDKEIMVKFSGGREGVCFWLFHRATASRLHFATTCYFRETGIIDVLTEKPQSPAH